MHIKTFFKNLKKRASGSVETAIKVLTAVVLGAAILMGLYGLVTGVVLPSTETAVSSMFAYSAEANGGSGTETPTPTPTPTPTIISFTLPDISYAKPDFVANRTVNDGTTWQAYINNDEIEEEFNIQDGYVLVFNNYLSYNGEYVKAVDSIKNGIYVDSGIDAYWQ